MAQYAITYDLHRERNYARLYALMARWRAIRLTESLWLAELLGPAKTIRDIVVGSVDNDDSVVVLQLTEGADWATQRVATAANNWLSNNVTPAEVAA